LANVTGQLTLDETSIVEVDADPSGGAGTPAPLGSLGVVNAGGFFRKTSAGDTGWTKVLDNLAVAAPVNLYQLQYNSTTGQWEPFNSLDHIYNNYAIFEDWIASTTAGDSGWLTTTNGTGAAASLLSSANTNTAAGVVSLACGTSNNGRCHLTSDSTGNGNFTLQGKTVYVETTVRVSGTGTSAALATTYMIGLGKTIGTGAHTDGAYFIFNGATNANWQCVTASASARTTTTSTVAVVAATWYTLEIIYNGTNVVFKINGTTVATHTLNIPTVPLFRSLSIQASGTSTTSKTMDVDFYVVGLTFAAARDSD
jgi:hypothetical protein